MSLEIRDEYYIMCPICGKEYNTYRGNTKVSRISFTCECGHQEIVHVHKREHDRGIPIK